MLRGKKGGMTKMNGRIFLGTSGQVLWGSPRKSFWMVAWYWSITASLRQCSGLFVSSAFFFPFCFSHTHAARFEYTADRVAHHLTNKVGNNLIVSDIAWCEWGVTSLIVVLALCNDLYAYLRGLLGFSLRLWCITEPANMRHCHGPIWSI